MPSPGQELASIDFASMLGGPLVAVINAQTQAAMSSVNFIKEVGFTPPPQEQDLAAQGVGTPIYVSFKYPKEVAPYDPGAPGTITGVTLTNPGSGYAAGSVTVSVTGDGNGATATATADASGAITSITITAGGTGYTNAQLSIPAPGGAGGTQATASVTLIPKRNPSAAQIQEMKLEVPILTMLPIPFIRIESTTLDFNAKINSVEYTKTDTRLKVDASLKVGYGKPFVGSVKLNVSTSYQRTTQHGTNVERTYSMAVHIRAVQDEMPAGLERILGILEDAIKAQPTKALAPVQV
jgi:hypothetical protein